MEAVNGHVLTLANSIIGVSILAMPYCFKQCGIILAVVILLFSNLLSRLSCHFLIKSAIIARRKTFENLAYYIFGGIGKFAIEVGMIGFLIGTCIAFFVVMGDLGPEIISEATGQEKTSTLRSTILLALTLFCVLPLGLLKNVDSLAGVSKATIGFYICLVIKIVMDALPHIFYGDWFNKVEFWRPAGVIQCIPIFSMALSCQTQLFEIYQVVHNPTLEKMNYVIKAAVNICTLGYFCVGFFGYIAFANKNFSGNILLNFSPSLLTNIMKIGFILSIAFSFPLVIFPCRASVHSLIYKRGVSFHESSTDYIPDARFKGLTLIIVFFSLIIGILIPNIEFVLGFVGSSIGIMICVLFPVICFIFVSQKDTNERMLAKFILIIGLILMILGTYENLHHLETIQSSPLTKNLVTERKELKLVAYSKDHIKNFEQPSANPNHLNNQILKQSHNETKIDPLVKPTESTEVRHEPPQPVEPQDSQPDSIQVKHKQQKELSNVNKEIEINLKENAKDRDKAVENEQPPLIKDQVQHDVFSLEKHEKENPENIQMNSAEQAKEKLPNEQVKEIGNIKNDEVDSEAIKKEDKEALLQQKELINNPHIDEHKILIDKIQKQNEVQEELVKQQKKLIEAFQKQQEEKANEEKIKAEIKAVKEIESIALKAIEKISGHAKENDQIVAKVEKEVLQKVNEQENLMQNEDKRNNSEKNVKIDDLKLMNSMLHAKIKENNVTQKPPKEIKDGDINENIEVIAANGPPENKIIHHASHNQIVSNNKTNILNNTVPLLLNLGQKALNDSNKTPAKDMLPFPLVVSNLKQQNVSMNDSNILSNITKVKNTNNFEDKNSENAKVMRRDILQYTNS